MTLLDIVKNYVWQGLFLFVEIALFDLKFY